MSNSKTCFKCGQIKSLENFYVHKQMSDGYLNKCKKCTKNDVKERDLVLRESIEYIEKERERGREKYKRLGYRNLKPSPETRAKSNANYHNNYPEKKIAKSRIHGLKPIIKGNQLHHWSYNIQHVKDVIELSMENHYLIHRHLIYDQTHFMYRRKDTNELLNTRQKHEHFIKIILQN